MESNKVTRTDIINHLIKTYGLKSYLEIGLQNAKQNFDKIECKSKVSVDPDPKAKAFYCMTSDEYFDQILNDQFMAGRKFDLIFIDGLHEAQQVKKDFENALRVLNDDGFIVLHDCNPEKEEHTIVPRPKPTGHWNGDVYKFACNLSINQHFNTIDIDNGTAVYRKIEPCLITDYQIDWTNFEENREIWLNLITYDQFKRTYTHV